MNNKIEVELQSWRGYSAYEVAVRAGFKGTEEEWLASLKGRDGGVARVNGVGHDEKGDLVITGSDIKVSNTNNKTMEQVAADVNRLTNAMDVNSEAIDVGGKYIDNARFR